jgi:hypothetical protein
MTNSSKAGSIADLDAYMEIVGSVLTAGKEESRLPSLCMMALIVREFPPGDLQDAAENILCTYIAEVRPSPEEMAEVRAARAGR